MSQILPVLGILGGLLGAVAAAFVAVRKAPSEVHLTQAQERKIAAETELLVTQTIRELRGELEEMRKKLELTEEQAEKDKALLRARVAELELQLEQMQKELTVLRDDQRRRALGRERERITDPPEGETK